MRRFDQEGAPALHSSIAYVLLEGCFQNSMDSPSMENNALPFMWRRMHLPMKEGEWLDVHTVRGNTTRQ